MAQVIISENGSDSFSDILLEEQHHGLEFIRLKIKALTGIG